MSTTLLIFGIALPWLIVALIVALGCWISFQLIHQNGRMLSRLETMEQRLGQLTVAAPGAPSAAPTSLATAPAVPGSPPGLRLGAPAPPFELPDLAGKRQSLAGFRGRRLLLIFFNPRCGFCTRMAPDIAALAVDEDSGQPLPVVVTTGDAEENRKLVAEHGIRCPVLLQQEMGVASQYLANGTPMGYLIDEQGRIASEMAIGGPALLALAERDGRPVPQDRGNGAGPLGGKRELSESKLQRNGLPTGTPAPDFRLPLLHGGELSLAEYRGREVLLVFSDPHCGPCDQLAPQLEQLARRTPGAQVLMVSRGDLEENRAKAAQHGLTFPVVLQRQWEVSREYAMFATPVAYRIDPEGRTAGEVAVGVEPILALLAGPAIPTNGNGAGKAPQGKRETGRRSG